MKCPDCGLDMEFKSVDWSVINRRELVHWCEDCALKHIDVLITLPVAVETVSCDFHV